MVKDGQLKLFILSILETPRGLSREFWLMAQFTKPNEKLNQPDDVDIHLWKLGEGFHRQRRNVEAEISSWLYDGF